MRTVGYFVTSDEIEGYFDYLSSNFEYSLDRAVLTPVRQVIADNVDYRILDAEKDIPVFSSAGLKFNEIRVTPQAFLSLDKKWRERIIECAPKGTLYITWSDEI